MLNAYPEYYKSFKCSAGECAHSCCIGWEIDIDTDTLSKYSCIDGDTGRRLDKNISLEGSPHFILNEDERCPFLNERGLCELILYGGEDMLCNICAEHPRFYNCLPDRTETGIGLCCEKAARLILESPLPVKLICEGSACEDDEYSKAVISLRDELLKIAGAADITYAEREEIIIRKYNISFPQRSLKQWADFYLSLERMDNEWTVLLEGLRDSHLTNPEYDSRCGNLLSYFIYRHIPDAYYDGEIAPRAAFALLSTRIINALCAVHGFDKIINISRLYSAEIEYSTENLNAVTAMF